MRKLLVGLMLAAVLVTYSVSIYARHGKFDGGPGRFNGRPAWSGERNDARYIIHRTAAAIFAAQEAAARGRNYFGLRQAIAHQQRASNLYWDGFYRKAIYHSLRARDLAFQVIAENRQKPRREYYHDQLEDRYAYSAPRDKELDINIDTVKVGKDEALVRLHFGLDISK
jgi:hypothetical protein